MRRRPVGRTLRAATTLWSLGFQAQRRLVMASLFLTGVENLRPLQAVALGRATDAALRGDATTAIRAAVVVSGFGVGFRFGSVQGFRLKTRINERTGLLLDSRMMELASDVPTLAHFEKPEYADRMGMLQRNAGGIAASSGMLMNAAGVTLSAVLTVVALVYLHPVLLLLPLFGLPSLWAAAKSGRLDRQADEELAEPHRRARHLFRLATEASSGMEVRVFALGDELRRRHRETWRGIDLRSRQAGWRSALLSAGAWAVFAVGFSGAIAFMAVEAAEGRATAGQVLATIALASGLTMQITTAAVTLQTMFEMLRAAEDYLWLVDYAAEQSHQPAGGARAVPDRLGEGIRVEGVSFTYPGVDSPVLQDVDLVLPAGSTIAIVGDNGAGKTTLVKLLCGFYSPSEGRVTVDGVPLDEIDLSAWRARIASGFQDFARYELMARETVGVGDLPRIDDEPAVVAAIDRAGASDVVDGLASGLETQLGRSWTGGTEISGGQWQKLALSRAMMRDLPLLLLLDEPTASLDAETEHQLFERYARSSSGLRDAAGSITLLISHRFSTVLMADLIVVMDAGRVVEMGTHHELLARAGTYAELFELQASGYR